MKPGQKRCSTCKTWKPITSFCNRLAAHDGKQSHCRDCSNKRVRSGNGSRTSAEKQSAAVCSACCNLPWRVEGIRCKRCRLRFAPEPAVELELHLRRFADIRSVV